MGGRVLLLTCANCNHRAGTEVDAELERSVDHALFAEFRRKLIVALEKPTCGRLVL